MDAHVQRAEALGDDPLEVGLGEARERREVAVEERQSVVVVLDVQARAQALRQLVDEAELAVVVARAHLVEQRASRLRRRADSPAAFVDRDGALEAAAAQLELEVGLVGQQPVLDDVTGGFAVDGHDLVAWLRHRPARPRTPGATATTVRQRHGGQGYRWVSRSLL